jgi:hypothetical protein
MKRLIVICLLILICNLACEKQASSPVSASSGSGTGGSLARFTIVNNTLYMVDYMSLKVYNITDPATTTHVKTKYIGQNIETIFSYKNTLFIGSSEGVYIYSLQDPLNPIQLGRATHARSCDPVVANDTIAYVTLRGGSACGPAQDGLYIHSVKNPANIQLIKTYAMPTPKGLGLKNNFLYVCQVQQGLSVLDVSDPLNPQLVKKITGSEFHDVIPYGNLLICYVTGGLALYDISQPANPVFVRSIVN